MRRCRTNTTVATAAARRYHQPCGANTSTRGSAVANARITPPSAAPRKSAPGRSAASAASHQPRRSTSGRLAVRHRTRNSRAATTASSPSGVAQRPEPHIGTNSCPQVTSVTSCVGSTTSTPAAAAPTSRQATPAQSIVLQPLRVSRPTGSSPTRIRRTATARATPTTRLTAKITRQSEKARISAPYNGRSRCRAPARPRRRRGGRPGDRPDRGRPRARGWPGPGRRRRRPGGTARSPGSAGRTPRW